MLAGGKVNCLETRSVTKLSLGEKSCPNVGEYTRVVLTRMESFHKKRMEGIEEMLGGEVGEKTSRKVPD
jgi:hypothetical protein